MGIRSTWFRGLAAAAVLVSLAVACSDSDDTQGQGPGAESGVPRSMPERLVDGSFLVSMKPGTASQVVTELANRAAGTFACTAAPPAIVDLFGLDTSTYNLRFTGCATTRDAAIALADELAKSPDVVSVKGEGLGAVDADPREAEQGHLGVIRRAEACAQVTTKTGPRVVVAVIDTGVEATHPDLKDVLLRDGAGAVVGANFLGPDGLDIDPGAPPDATFADTTGHGTHVAGLVAAAADNGVGGAGVGACANVVVMPVRVCAAGCPALAVERGIAWAVRNGADVLNLSLGGWEQVWGSSTLTSAATRSATENSVVVVASAGNESRRNGVVDGRYTTWKFPASYDGAVGVGATTLEGALASFTNLGPRVRVAAPGVDLLSTLQGDYGRLSGTSMSAPLVSGAYALGLAASRALPGSPAAGRIDVARASQLLGAAILDGKPLDANDVESKGILDAERLVRAVASTPLTEPPQPDADAGDGGLPEAGPGIVEGVTWTSIGDILADDLGEPIVQPERPSDVPRGQSMAYGGGELFVTASLQNNIPWHRLFVRRFDGTTWRRAGAPLETSVGGSASTLLGCSTMTASRDGKVYVGFFKMGSGAYYAVRQYDPAADEWDAVGGDITSAESLDPFTLAATFCEGRSALAIDAQGRPVVALRSRKNAAIVKRLEGGAWVAVGAGEGGLPSPVGATDGVPTPLQLVIGPGDVPFLATSDADGVHVRKFTGTWVGVGANDGLMPGVTAGLDANQNLAVFADGTALHAQTQTPFAVRRFDGTTWAPITDFENPTGLRSVRLLLDPAGNPIVSGAFTDFSRRTAVLYRRSGGTIVSLGPTVTVGIDRAAGARTLAYSPEGRLFMLFESNVYRLD